MRQKPLLDLTFRTPEGLLQSCSSSSGSSRVLPSDSFQKPANPRTSFEEQHPLSARKSPFLLKSPFETVSQRKIDSSPEKPGAFSFENQPIGVDLGFFRQEFENNPKFVDGRAKILRIHRVFEAVLTGIAVLVSGFLLKTGLSAVFPVDHEAQHEKRQLFWAWLAGSLFLRGLCFSSKPKPLRFLLFTPVISE